MTALPPSSDYTGPITQAQKKAFMTSVRNYLSGLLGDAGDKPYMDEIAEKTSGHGVLIDGVTLKDGGVSTTAGSEFKGLTLVDAATPSKKVALSAAAISAATTRTWSYPDASAVFVGDTVVQTLTNKTLTAPVIDGTARGTLYGIDRMQVRANWARHKSNGVADPYGVLNLVAADFIGDTDGKPSFASFIRASGASYTDARGRLMTAGAGVLRHDFDPVTGQYLGWLIEEQRSNLLTYSEALDNAAVTKLNATVPVTNITAPDGAATADELLENNSNGVHVALQSITGNATAQHSFSVFAKAPSSPRRFVLDLDDGSGNGVRATFNVAAGTVSAASATGSGGGTPSATITPYPNGWYRCAVSGIPNISTGSTVRGLVRLIDAGGNESYTGDNASGVYLWGRQLEAGSFPTSYIATAASQVTRAADLLTIPISAFAFNPAEFTVFVDHTPMGSLSSRGIVSLDDGSNVNRAYLGLNSGGGYEGTVVAASAVQAQMSNTAGALNTRARLVLAVRANEFAHAVNNNTVATDNAGAVPTGITTLQIGAAPDLSRCNGWYHQIACFPRRLANADLQPLIRL